MNTRVLMLPVSGEVGASTRYRVLAHRPALHAAGFETRVRYPLDFRHTGAGRILYRFADMMRDLYASDAADVLFVQRKTYLPGLADRLRAPGRTVVYDMDDAIDLPPPGAIANARTLRRYRENFEATVRAADLVLCGNRFLASRLPHGRYEILPTPIDGDRFRPGAVGRGDGSTLGWVGYSDNLPYLEALSGALAELARRRPGLRLVVVADRAPRIPGIELEYRPWSLENELACFDGIDIGLMPLEDSPWARGKCAFKAIQYMALGIPAVASPVGMNLEVIRDGETGFLPRDPAGWIEVIDRLVGDPAMARSVGQAGRRVVERSYALDVLSERLVEVLRSLHPPARKTSSRGGP